MQAFHPRIIQKEIQKDIQKEMTQLDYNLIIYLIIYLMLCLPYVIFTLCYLYLMLLQKLNILEMPSSLSKGLWLFPIVLSFNSPWLANLGRSIALDIIEIINSPFFNLQVTLLLQCGILTVCSYNHHCMVKRHQIQVLPQVCGVQIKTW